MSELPEHETWKIIDSTKVNDFMECPRKYFYKYVVGWKPDTPNNHLHFGVCWHIAMEHLLLHGYEDQSIIDAYEKFLHEYRMEFPPETDEIFYPKTPDNALIVLTKYCQEHPDDMKHYRTVDTELAGTITIGEDRFLYFRMDSILERISDEKIKSREHKTGSGSFLWKEQWHLAFQAGAYNHVLNCLYDPERVLGVEMNGSMFRKVKKGWEQMATNQKLTVQPPYEFVRDTIHKNNRQMQSWMDMANAYFASIEYEHQLLEKCQEDDDTLEAFPMCPISCVKYNRVCEYHDFCLSWPNPLRKVHAPEIGFVVDFWNPMEADAKKVVNV